MMPSSKLRSLRARILSLPVLATLFLALILVSTSLFGARISSLLERIETGYSPAVEQNRDLEDVLTAIQRGLQDAVAAEDKDALADVQNHEKEFAAKLEQMRTNPVRRPEEVDALARLFEAYVTRAHRISEAMIGGEASVASELGPLTEQYRGLRTALAEDTERSRAARADAFRDAARAQSISRAVVGTLGLVCTLLMVWVSRRVTLGVLGRLQRLTDTASRIAKDGDLSVPVDDESDDELGELARSFGTMVGQLREVHSAIDVAVHRVASAAAQIHASTQEQEAASQTQSTGAEEVNRTMQSLLEAATHIAESANGVFTNAERAKETSATTAAKIAELSGHTERMSEILEVIREIADRSDLLALNASLEGTRAGEAGRGFALVATEMRRLSERVTASVKDVKALVTDIRASGASTVVVTEEARALAEGTAVSARQINQVTQQQRSATEQVTRSMHDVVSVLMQSVAANRQTRKAAEDLKLQAEQLTALTVRFRGTAAAKPAAQR